VRRSVCRLRPITAADNKLWRHPPRAGFQAAQSLSSGVAGFRQQRYCDGRAPESQAQYQRNRGSLVADHLRAFISAVVSAMSRGAPALQQGHLNHLFINRRRLPRGDAKPVAATCDRSTSGGEDETLGMWDYNLCARLGSFLGIFFPDWRGSCKNRRKPCASSRNFTYLIRQAISDKSEIPLNGVYPKLIHRPTQGYPPIFFEKYLTESY